MKRHLHLEGYSGLSGDMWLGLLFDLGLRPAELNAVLAGLKIPGLALKKNRVLRAGLSGVQVRVMHSPDPQPARGLKAIRALLNRSSVPRPVKETALGVFQVLAEAEAKLHGRPIDEIHFHEVGALDALADIVGVCAGLELLGIQAVTIGPINIGSGTVAAAHGRLPVPAPATLELLSGFPVFSEGPAMEMTTPTGAALVKRLARPAAYPLSIPERVGYGAGTQDPHGWPNLLRGSLSLADAPEAAFHTDRVMTLITRVDDVTPQVLGYVLERVMANGALDASLQPVQMKKNRPGHQIEVICAPEQTAELLTLLFKETGTLGIRIQPGQRAILPRRQHAVQVRGCRVSVKEGYLAGRRITSQPEYDDAMQCAAQTGTPLREVIQEARQRHKEKA